MLGFININKPKGITSHDVVNKVRKIVGIKQVGHGGTLDPMAEGVMVVAVGKATRLLQFVQDDKVYLAAILLGVQTDTDDLEGEVILKTDDLSHISEEMVTEKIERFRGKQLQVPPIYSAIKKGGMKLYDLARRGEAPDVIDSREIEIFSIETIAIDLPVVTVRIACSKGTYIRSIARDLGSQLGVGATLKSLVRERSGPFAISDSHTTEQLSTLRDQNALPNAILSLDATLGLPSLHVDKECAKRVVNGQAIRAEDVDEEEVRTADEKRPLKDADEKGPLKDPERNFVIFFTENKPIALMKRYTDGNGDKFKPEVVLTNAKEL